MKSLAVRVLGDFAVDGLEPQAVGSRKGRRALRVLALAAGQPVPAGVLIEALWEDAPPARPDDQLAVLVSRLRSVVGRDRIERGDGGYRLRCDWVDAVELAALTDEADRRRQSGNAAGAAAAARVALSLLRGYGPPPLPGGWAALKLAELDRLTARARQVAAAALLEAGDWMTAADAAQAALDLDGYDEASLRILLRACVAGGRAGAALAAYGDARQRLAEELGTDPSPETTALYTAILHGELAAPPQPSAGPAGRAGAGPAGAGLAGNGLAGRDRLVGRDADLAYLDATAARARSGRAEVVVVDGEAGIGKTALLRAFAAGRAAAGDTVLLAPCGTLDQAMPLDAVLSALAALLRRLGPQARARLLDDDAAILEPALGGTVPRLPPVLADGMLGPAVLYAALARLIGRLAANRPVAVLIDDAHLAGPPLANWLAFLRRENVPAAVVAAARSGEGQPLPATARVHLDVLGRTAAAQLTGTARADELFERSGGHPLFLTELAQQVGRPELPASLVESVSGRCDELGTAGTMLRTAAVIGPELDIDLLAALLGRPAVELLDEAEQAVARQLLTADGAGFRFRHELVREALAASASAGRAALLHRQAGRVLAQRSAADPAAVAGHARLGGDLALAARALREAAAQAAERFDHAAAEALLDDALRLHPDAEGWLERARVRTRRGRYPAALRDVSRAAAAGPAALEVGAWACYFGRRFGQTVQYAADGALAAADPVIRSRCLAVGGRTQHAAGELARAEALLAEAFALAEGPDRVTAAAWLGVLRAHQSRSEEALTLLHPAARAQAGAAHTAAALHALLFTGHVRAMTGHPAQALAAFSRYTAEVERRQVPRFAGRGVNFAGWVLRSLGAADQAREHHLQALAAGQGQGTADVTIAALEDLAELAVEAADPDAARARLAQAAGMLDGELVFGWRLELKHQLVSARLELLCGDGGQALALATGLAARAADLGVPRYASAARLLVQLARRELGEPASLDAAAGALEQIRATAALEAWWWTGQAAAAFGVPAWLEAAAGHAARLAGQAGDYADVLQQAAGRRLEQWRAQAARARPGARR